MSIGITDNKHYTEIADAIRKKLGNESKYKPEEMAAAILSIVGGGGAVSIFESSASGEVQKMPEGTASDEFTVNFISESIGSVWAGEPRTDVAVEFTTIFENSCSGSVWSGEPRADVETSFDLEFETQVTAELQEE